MGFFDRLFGNWRSTEQDVRLNEAIEQVIKGTDPRMRALGEVKSRLAPAVSRALDFARGMAARLPACIEMSPAHSSLVRRSLMTRLNAWHPEQSVATSLSPS